MSQKNYMDDDAFNNKRTSFVTNAKQAWENLTVLFCDTVEYYNATKNTGRIRDMANSLEDTGNAEFFDTFEKAVYLTTNVKFRRDPEDVEAKITCTTRGKSPDDWLEQLNSIRDNGIQTKAKKVKSNRRTAKMNNDGQSKPREKDKESTEGTITHLKATESGKQLVDVAEMVENLEGDKKEQARIAMQQMSEVLSAIANGEAPVPIETPPVAVPAGVPEGIANKITQVSDKLASIVDAACEDEVSMKKLDSILDTMIVQLNAQERKAIAKLGKSSAA